jgi:hypothetical protein
MFIHREAAAQTPVSYDSRDAYKYSPGVTNVFPNPVINSASIVLNYTPLSRINIDLVDFNGQLRRKYVFNPGNHAMSIDVSDLDKGFYVLRVREQNILVDIVKLVKN